MIWLYFSLYLVIGWIFSSILAYTNSLVDEDNPQDEVLFFVINLLFWPVPGLLIIARLGILLIEDYINWLKK